MPASDRAERGASLILALVFLTAISVMILGVASLAVTDLLGSSHLAAQRSSEYAADGAIDAAIQSVRYSYNPFTTTGLCTPGATTSLTINNTSVEVYCSGTINIFSGSTRTVTFFACPVGQSASVCTAGPIVTAQVVFDDYTNPTSPAKPVRTCNITSGTTTCGTSLTIKSWIVAGSTN